MTTMADTMAMMEHPESSVSVPPLVDPRVLDSFCRAIQAYADSVGCHDEIAEKLRILRLRLDELRGLASLGRLAIVGHGRSLGRVADELNCVSIDFPCDPLERIEGEEELNEDERDTRVQLGAAIDLFAAASFCSKGRSERRDRLVVGAVRAIESAIGFPVSVSQEAATYLGEGDGTQSPLHAKLVIANAMLRLLESDKVCVPRPPAEIRRRLYCLARRWMLKNPVDLFFETISGPRVTRIVHWEDPSLPRPDDARVGDRVTLLLEREQRNKDDADSDCEERDLSDFSVMFCTHEPAPVVRIVDDGLEVLVPERARTGPIAVVKTKPDFTPVKDLLAAYAASYVSEWSFSVFSSVRMDTWAFPSAFGGPVLEVLPQRSKGDTTPVKGQTPTAMQPVMPKMPAGRSVPQ